jgi:lipopolysaccharide/colanic/teichoic acid biosynthesis glycosyltransferase
VRSSGLDRALRAAPALLALAVVADLALVHAACIGHYPLFGDGWRVGWELAYAAVLAAAASVCGVTEPPRRLVDAVVASGSAVVVAAVAMSGVQLVTGSEVLPRFVVFAAAGVLAPGYLGLAVLADRVRRDHDQIDRVVAVVGASEALALARDLDGAAERSAVLVGTVDVADARPGRRAQPLVDLATERRATVVVLDRAAQVDEAVVAQAARLHGAGVRVRTLSLFYDQWLGKLPVGELERMSLMFDIQELHGRQYARVKRLVDVVVAAVGCVVLAVVTPVVAAADLVGNRGPLLFRQPRVGRGGQPFTILKFRTMPVASAGGLGAGCGASRQADDPVDDRGGPIHRSGEVDTPWPWTAADDGRLGRVGRWLRRSHLDELPQMVNVLRGELSLVGPRPEQPCYVAELQRKVPFYDVRHLVHPGLTGWAQVKFPYGASVADAVEKLQYEFFYLRHQSLRLDLRILVRTARTVVAGRGR